MVRKGQLADRSLTASSEYIFCKCRAYIYTKSNLNKTEEENYFEIR